jgi:hypothetical protein
MVHRKGSDLIDRRGMQYELGDLVIFDTRWEAMHCPYNVLPGTSPRVDADTGTLLFRPNKPQQICGIAHLPHRWHEGTPLRPHVHWQKTSDESGDVVWELDYDVVTNGEVAPRTYNIHMEALETEQCAHDDDTMDRLLITCLGKMNMEEHVGSDLIFWRLLRKASDTLDTYPSDARLCTFDIFYQANTLGSQDIFTGHDKHDEERD